MKKEEVKMNKKKLQSEATQKRIYTAAVKEFTTHGYWGTRIYNVADAGKVSQAWITKRYGGKEGLFKELIEEYVQPEMLRIPEADNLRELLLQIIKVIKSDALNDRKVFHFINMILESMSVLPESLVAIMEETFMTTSMARLIKAYLSENNITGITPFQSANTFMRAAYGLSSAYIDGKLPLPDDEVYLALMIKPEEDMKNPNYRDVELEKLKSSRDLYSSVADLSADYDFICRFNNETAETQRYHISEKFLRLFPELAISDKPESSDIDNFFKRFVFAVDFDTFRSVTGKDAILKYIKQHNTYSHRFRALVGGEIKLYEVKFSQDSRDEKCLAFGLQDVSGTHDTNLFKDSDIGGDISRKREIIEVRNLVSNELKKDYEFIFAVNKDSGVSNEYHISARAMDYFNQNRDNVYAGEMLSVINSKLVSIDYLNEVMAMGESVETDELWRTVTLLKREYTKADFDLEITFTRYKYKDYVYVITSKIVK